MKTASLAPRLPLYAVAVLGLGAGAYRFRFGLGASTNLSDAYPWGIWIGIDVLSGVALAAGGFTIAAAIYVLHLEKYRPVLRPAILTAFLGYALVAAGLFFDLGRPYRIWHPLIMWNQSSVMFEVAWCVILYLSVLALEFAPAVFERYKWTLPFKLSREKWSFPLKILRAITLPLVFAGIVLSTLHQSSLGSLFLIFPYRLHQLWYSPGLPIFFFMSAVGVGLGVVIIEAHISARVYGFRFETDIVEGLARAAQWVLLAYLLARTADLLWRGVLGTAFDGSRAGNMFLVEMIGGVILPMILFWFAKIKKNTRAILPAAALVVAGVIVNRINVSIVGMTGPQPGHYFPSWMEIMITLGLIAAGLISYDLAVRLFNVLEYEGKPA